MTSASIIWAIARWLIIYPSGTLLVMGAWMLATDVELPSPGEVDSGLAGLLDLSWGERARAVMSGMLGGMLVVMGVFVAPGRLALQMIGFKGWITVALGIPSILRAL